MESVKLLLEAGADEELINKYGQTADDQATRKVKTWLADTKRERQAQRAAARLEGWTAG